MGQIRQNAEAKTEIGPPSTDRTLYSDKARSFNLNHSARYIETLLQRILIKGFLGRLNKISESK